MKSARGFHRDTSGQISFFLVFATVAFVALIGLIVNTGDTVSRKVRSQSTADAVTLSSATWVARGLNVHSAINVFQTQLVGTAVNMHALHDSQKATMPIACFGVQAAWKAFQAIPVPFNLAVLPVLIAFGVAWGAEVITQPILGADFPNAFHPTCKTIKGAKVCEKLAEGKKGWFWKLSDVLEKVNKVVGPAFSLLAESQAIMVARANGADWGHVVSLGEGPSSFLPWVPTKVPPRGDAEGTAAFCKALDEGGKGYSELHGYDEGQGPWRAGRDRYYGNDGNAFGVAQKVATAIVGQPWVYESFSDRGYRKLGCGEGDMPAGSVPITSDGSDEAPGIPVEASACEAKNGFSHWKRVKYRWKSTHDEPGWRNADGQVFRGVHDPPAGRAPEYEVPNEGPSLGQATGGDQFAGGTPTFDVTTIVGSMFGNIGNTARQTVESADDRFFGIDEGQFAKLPCDFTPSRDFHPDDFEPGDLLTDPEGALEDLFTDLIGDIEDAFDPDLCVGTRLRRLKDGVYQGWCPPEEVQVQQERPAETCGPEVQCTGGFDEDFDGFTDCDDRDCRLTTACRGELTAVDPPRESCWNGLDDDDDGDSDCDDIGDCGDREDCPGVPPNPCVPRAAQDDVFKYHVDIVLWVRLGYYYTDLGDADAEDAVDETMLPMPALFDVEEDELDDALSYVGMVSRQNRRRWGEPLYGEGGGLVTYAQAEVYNGVSDADLFAQDWRVRLVPADLTKPQVAAAMGLLLTSAGDEAAGAAFAGTALASGSAEGTVLEDADPVRILNNH